jgi:hypothetical protein
MESSFGFREMDQRLFTVPAPLMRHKLLLMVRDRAGAVAAIATPRPPTGLTGPRRHGTEAAPLDRRQILAGGPGHGAV